MYVCRGSLLGPLPALLVWTPYLFVEQCLAYIARRSETDMDVLGAFYHTVHISMYVCTVHMMRPCTLAAGSIRVASQMLAIEPLCSRHSPIYIGTQYSTLNDSLMNIYMLLHKYTFFLLSFA